MKIILRTFATLLLVTSAGSFSMRAQTQISGSGYSQDFESLGAGLPDDWSLHTGATISSFGTNASFTSTSTSWGDGAGAFKNFASTGSGLISEANPATQAAATDRALGVRQTGSFGDPGAAFIFNFSSSGVMLTSLQLDLLMLSVQTRSTIWTIDYGVGAAPSNFISLDTWTDPGVFGTTTITILSDLANLSDQSNVWLRVAALNTATGGGSRDSIAIDNFSISATAIPEPATYAAACGVAGLLCAVARRRRPPTNRQTDGVS